MPIPAPDAAPQPGAAAIPTDLRRVPDVARQVGLSTVFLYRLIAAREFPAPIHIGRSARLVGGEVDQWIADRIAQCDGVEAANDG
ncbi:MAG TPA: AlpA family phage regulatory protein [Rhodanobacteraceae bacterium]|nr:AlpA family phage regulatory protein [Rhodanobacteraceae bacterium]